MLFFVRGDRLRAPRASSLRPWLLLCRIHARLWKFRIVPNDQWFGMNMQKSGLVTRG